VATAVYLINRMPSKILHFKTPLQTLSIHISLPSILILPPKIFECAVFVHLHKNQHTKLEPCAVRCLFLGYGLHKKGFRCYDPKTNRTYTTMDVTFLESEIFFPSPVPNSSLQGEITQVEESNWLMTPMSEHNCEQDTEHRIKNSSTEHETGNREDEHSYEQDIEHRTENSSTEHETGNREDELHEVQPENDTEHRTVNSSTEHGTGNREDEQPTGHNTEHGIENREDELQLEIEHVELRNEEPGNDLQSPHSSVLKDPPPTENVIEVSTPTATLHANILNSSTSYVLPFRHNRRKSPNKYSPDEEEKKSKYPIANYVSTKVSPICSRPLLKHYPLAIFQ